MYICIYIYTHKTAIGPPPPSGAGASARAHARAARNRSVQSVAHVPNLPTLLRLLDPNFPGSSLWACPEHQDSA